MKYNPAEAYALAIGHLADRLAGGAPFIASWPRDERALSIAERYEMQQLLARRGFDVGAPDGLLGPRTRVAIRNFQIATGPDTRRFCFELGARPVAAALTSSGAALQVYRLASPRRRHVEGVKQREM